MGIAGSKLPTDLAVFASSFVPSPTSIVSESERANWRTYDYVIVGAGAAGCALAARLSEDRDTTVLLLEAGESHGGKFWSRVPLAFERMLRSPSDWGFYTTPQESLHGRIVEWPRGKILGGTSSINASIYHQCDPEDFDNWERLGATGWGYSTMKNYFEKTKTGGPCIAANLPLAPISSRFIKAAESFGLPYRDGFNTEDASTVGVGPLHGAIDEKHERSSSATAYLTSEVLKRPNLTVAVSVHTERILFTSGEIGNLRGVGVQISSTRAGPKFAVGASKEVILSAGTVGSPQIMLCSGVGPSAQLEKLNIPVVHDLPAVGRGLLDHFSPGSLIFRAKAGVTWDYLTQVPLNSAIALLRWLAAGTGPMSALCAQIAVFARSDDASLPYGPQLPVKDTTSPKGDHGISVGAVLLKPSSVGSIELRTNSVYDPPLIDPNYLGDKSDLNVLIRATRFLLRLARTEPLLSALDLKNLSTAPKDPDHYWIGDADPEKVSDEEIEAWIRKWGQSSLHPTSSMRMGPDPAKSVVDVELRVHGIQGLRVADASVFPDQLSGHPCVPVIAVAERAADLIKGVA